MYTCPVCGYPGLRRPPEDHTICPSCGIQFWYHDAGPEPPAYYHPRLRYAWAAKGAKWHSKVIMPPIGWNPWKQMHRAGLDTSLLRTILENWKHQIYCWWHGICPIHGRPDFTAPCWSKDNTPICLKCLYGGRMKEDERK